MRGRRLEKDLAGVDGERQHGADGHYGYDGRGVSVNEKVRADLKKEVDAENDDKVDEADQNERIDTRQQDLAQAGNDPARSKRRQQALRERLLSKLEQE